MLTVVTFWRMEIDTKAAHKMLVKLPYVLNFTNPMTESENTRYLAGAKEFCPTLLEHKT